jgi:hypothetical protein
MFTCAVPPSIYPPEDEIHILNATQSVSLSCFASGYPRPQIRWQKNGNDISNDTHMRYVLCVLKSGECFLHNGI